MNETMPVGTQPKNRFAEIIGATLRLRENALENLKLAISIQEALLGPLSQDQAKPTEKAAKPPGQFYEVVGRLQEINGFLLELRDILTNIKKESVV
jgi:hypothetical protein